MVSKVSLTGGTSSSKYSFLVGPLTPQDWATPHFFTVTAVDDARAEWSRGFPSTYPDQPKASGQNGDDALRFLGISASDRTYNALEPEAGPVPVFIRDNDLPGLVVMHPFSRLPSRRVVSYRGGEAFTVEVVEGRDKVVRWGLALTSQPFGEVTVQINLSLESQGPAADWAKNTSRVATLDPDVIRFNPYNWNDQQPLACLIVDDHIMRALPSVSFAVKYEHFPFSCPWACSLSLSDFSVERYRWVVAFIYNTHICPP